MVSDVKELLDFIPNVFCDRSTSKASCQSIFSSCPNVEDALCRGFVEGLSGSIGLSYTVDNILDRFESGLQLIVLLLKQAT